MRHSKILILCLLAVLSAAAFAGQPTPFVFQKDGVPFGVGYNIQGLQFREPDSGQASGARAFNPLQFDFSPENGAVFFQKMATDWGGGGGGGGTAAGDTRIRFSLHRADQGGGNAGSAQVGMVTPGFVSLSIPALDGASKDPAYMRASLSIDDLSVDGFFGVSKAERDLVKSQKNWVPSNFKLEIDGVSTAGFRVEPIRIDAGDLNGDGLPDLTTTNLVIKGPILGSPEYFAWFANIQKGVDDTRDCRYTLFLNDGTPCCSIHIRVRPISIGASDFFDFISGLGGTFTVAMKTGTVKFFNEAKGFG